VTKLAKNIVISVAVIFIFMEISVALYAGPFASQWSELTRMVTSAAAAVFVVLCGFGAVSIFFAMYYFYRMVDSPQAGQTLFDARAARGGSLFSDSYLNEDGRAMRGRLFAALRWFLASWLGAVLLALVMYRLSRVG
jgi:hypothetical protein